MVGSHELTMAARFPVSRSRGRWCRWAMVCSFVIVATADSRISSAGEWSVEAYRAGLRRLQGYYEALDAAGTRAEYSEVVADRRGRQLMGRYEYRFVADHDLGKLSQSMNLLDEEGRIRFHEAVLLHAPPRAYAIRRDESKGPYSIKGVERVDGIIDDGYRKIANGMFRAPLSMHGLYLPDLFDDTGFKFRRITEARTGGERLARIDFEYRPANGRATNDGWLLVDPTRSWALRRFEYHFTAVGRPGFSLKGECRYEGSQDGVPLLRSASLIESYPEGVVYTYDSNITKIEHASTPPESFTLAAYGLGQFEKPVGASTNTTAYWFYALATVALIAGAMLMVRRRRRAAD